MINCGINIPKYTLDFHFELHFNIYIKCLDCLDFQTELFDVSAEQLATSTEDLLRTGRIQFKVLTTLPLKFKGF